MGAFHNLSAGGNWREGVLAGARAVALNNYPWNVNAVIGARCALSSQNVYYMGAFHKLIAGAYWRDGIHAGARAVNLGNYPWNVNTAIGARCALSQK